MIGIIGAMEIEISGLVFKLTDKVSYTVHGLNFTVGKIKGKSVTVVRCGIGKVNAAYAAALMIERFCPDLIVNVGVAGGLREDIRQGDIVLASDSVQHDYDLTPDGKMPGQINEMDFVKFVSDKVSLDRLIAIVESFDYPYRVGTIATGDQFICDKVRSDQIRQAFDGFACDMESAAIAQVCYMSEIPFLSMRAISDGAGEGAYGNFLDFCNIAAEKAIAVICRFIETSAV